MLYSYFVGVLLGSICRKEKLSKSAPVYHLVDLMVLYSSNIPWIMHHCIKRDYDESLAVVAGEKQPDLSNLDGVDIEGDAIAAGSFYEDGGHNEENPEEYYTLQLGRSATNSYKNWNRGFVYF
ncbi:unnamed protein product [Debaryomyces tyrocola]|nr:unnamed protein product [Debaryomyces tyrocola]